MSRWSPPRAGTEGAAAWLRLLPPGEGAPWSCSTTGVDETSKAAGAAPSSPRKRKKKKKRKGLLAPPPRPSPIAAAAELRSRHSRCLNPPPHDARSLSAASEDFPGTGVRRTTLRGPSHRRRRGAIHCVRRRNEPRHELGVFLLLLLTGTLSSWFPFQRFTRLTPVSSRGA